MLFAPQQAELSLIATNWADGSRPGANPGTTVTARHDGDYSAAVWTTLLSSGDVTSDVYELHVQNHNFGLSGQGFHGSINIGYDPAGGTSFTPLVYLFGGQSGAATIGGHHWHLLCRVPAGSTIGARAVWSHASDGASCKVVISAFGLPSPSHLYCPASRVQSIGIDTVDTYGVSVVTGTASEGDWILIGQLDFDAFAWEIAFGTANSALNANRYEADLGWCDVSSPASPDDVHKIIERNYVITTAAEQSYKPRNLTYKRVPAGSYIFGRAQMGPNALPAGSTYISAIAMGR